VSKTIAGRIYEPYVKTIEPRVYPVAVIGRLHRGIDPHASSRHRNAVPHGDIDLHAGSTGKITAFPVDGALHALVPDA
jgi:hypothetical protein